jgi:anti-sigma regulatory factor (Ser/Thr protein kinase)/anti-anti-sigma regulatory factor
VELRETCALAATDRLYAAFSSPCRSDRIAVQTLERLTRETRSTDDITMLAVQRTERLTPLHLDTDLTPDNTGAVRDAVANWFRPGQIDRRSLEHLELIITEICENSIEHAYHGVGGPITLTANLDDVGTVELTISDRGMWRPPAPPANERGRGLAVVQQLCARLHIDRDTDGTRIRLQYRAWKRSTSTVPRSPAARTELFDVFHEHRNGSATLTIRGPVDATAIAELDGQLGLCTTPGSPDLVIDLNDVTLLTSSAIRSLRIATQRAAQAGIDVTLACQPGTTAQQVLAIAGVAVRAALADDSPTAI